MPVADTIHWRIKTAVVSTIQALNLEPLPGHAALPVVNNLVPDDSNTKLPAVWVTTEGEIEELLGGDSENFHTLYPVRVFIADRNTGRQHDKEPYYLDWRRRIRGAFQDKLLAGVNEVRGCRWFPQVIIDPNMPVYQLVVSGMLLKFYTVEART